MSRGELIKKLRSLSATRFENLVYDMMISAGLRNAVWRTPGADGGRDIEGEIRAVDFSGEEVSSKWYVECKRYRSSVDWPTVWKKVAYADNQKADVLFLVTTGNVTPQCKTEIANWNGQRRRLCVRIWDATVIERELERFPLLILKYGLAFDRRDIPGSFLPLARQASKITQAAYGVLAISGQQNVALEAAAAISELLTVKLEDAELGRPFVRYAFDRANDAYDWLVVRNGVDFSSFDRYGLRAVLAVLRHVTNADHVTVVRKDPWIEVRASPERRVIDSAQVLMRQISVIGDLAIGFGKNKVTLQARKQ